jgi:hypothetical protein
VQPSHPHRSNPHTPPHTNTHARAHAQVSPYQAAVLMLFNSAQQMSYADIHAATQVPHADLKRALQSLACVPKSEWRGARGRAACGMGAPARRACARARVRACVRVCVCVCVCVGAGSVCCGLAHPPGRVLGVQLVHSGTLCAQHTCSQSYMASIITAANLVCYDCLSCYVHRLLAWLHELRTLLLFFLSAFCALFLCQRLPGGLPHNMSRPSHAHTRLRTHGSPPPVPTTRPTARPPPPTHTHTHTHTHARAQRASCARRRRARRWATRTSLPSTPSSLRRPSACGS